MISARLLAALLLVTTSVPTIFAASSVELQTREESQSPSGWLGFRIRFPEGVRPGAGQPTIPLVGSPLFRAFLAPDARTVKLDLRITRREPLSALGETPNVVGLLLAGSSRTNGITLPSLGTSSGTSSRSTSMASSRNPPASSTWASGPKAHPTCEDRSRSAHPTPPWRSKTPTSAPNPSIQTDLPPTRLRFPRSRAKAARFTPTRSTSRPGKRRRSTKTTSTSHWTLSAKATPRRLAKTSGFSKVMARPSPATAVSCFRPATPSRRPTSTAKRPLSPGRITSSCG